ncbi:MAG: hypothetical protein H8E44_35470 [Planctomycetes bacterium]|nr:hypothetical protein [Planctomycetota bacterium]MBL7038916.1 hypothetical protein [Pirellulaceae bacterium]
MFRKRFRIRDLATAAFVFGTLLALNFGPAATATADSVKKVDSYDPSLDVYAYFDADGNLKSYHVYDKKGKHVFSKYFDNPNPEEGTTSPGDVGSREQLALQNASIKGILGSLTDPNVWESRVGKHQTGGGKGYVVVSNPGDHVTQGDGSGSSNGGSSSGNLFDEMEREKNTPHQGQGGGGYDGSGGSLGDYVKGLIKKGSQGDDDDNDDDGSAPPDPWAGLPGPPELVNPDPVSQGFVLVSPFGSSHGAQVGSVAKTRAAGQANAAFQLGAFGPSGAGRAAPRPTTALPPTR